jgi:hypothetical protein
VKNLNKKLRRKLKRNCVLTVALLCPEEKPYARPVVTLKQKGSTPRKGKVRRAP